MKLLLKKALVYTLAATLGFSTWIGTGILQVEKAKADAPVLIAAWTFPDGNIGTADEGTVTNLGKEISWEGINPPTYITSSGNPIFAARATGWDNTDGDNSWQVNFSTAGYQSISLSSKQKSTDTRPKNFVVQVSSDGINWSADLTNVVLANDEYSSGTLFDLDLTGVSTNSDFVAVRWLMKDTTPVVVDETHTTVKSTGASFIDDISVTGLPIVSGENDALIQAKDETKLSTDKFAIADSSSLTDNTAKFALGVSYPEFQPTLNPDLSTDILMTSDVEIPVDTEIVLKYSEDDGMTFNTISPDGFALGSSVSSIWLSQIMDPALPYLRPVLADEGGKSVIYSFEISGISQPATYNLSFKSVAAEGKVDVDFESTPHQLGETVNTELIFADIAANYGTAATLLSEVGINNNLDQVTAGNIVNFMPTFEMEFLGRIQFDEMNLLDPSTIDYLSALVSKLKMENGKISLDTTGSVFENLPATVEMYGMDKIGIISGVTNEQILSYLRATDKTGNLIPNLVSDVNLDRSKNVLSFRAVHFTTFEIDKMTPTVKTTTVNLSSSEQSGSNIVNPEDSILIVATFDKSISKLPTISIGTDVTNVLMAASDNPMAFTFTWNVKSDEQPGVLPLSIIGVDIFGNEFTVAPQSFVVKASNQAELAIAQNVPSNTVNELLVPSVFEPNHTYTINVPKDVTNPILNVSGILSGTDSKEATLPALKITAATVSGDIVLEIPAGTTISGPADWDGKINIPRIIDQNIASLLDPALAGSDTLAIEIGSNDVPLNLSEVAKITLPGQAGKSVAYLKKVNGKDILVAISDTCTFDEVKNVVLAEGKECKYNADNKTDLVIATRHFTKFLSFKEEAVAPNFTLAGQDKFIKIQWQGTGADSYDITINGTWKENIKAFPSDLGKGYLKEYSVAEYGTYSILVTAIKNGIYSNNTAVKKITFDKPVEITVAEAPTQIAPQRTRAASSETAVTVPSDSNGQIKGSEEESSDSDDVNWTPWIILFILIALAGAATGGYLYWSSKEEISEKQSPQKKPVAKKKKLPETTKTKNKKIKRW